MKLTVVGCSPAWPNPGGAQSGYLLEGPGRLLLDCGPGVLARLRSTDSKNGWPRVDAIAITHFHLDHWGDLVPWVWGTMWGLGRDYEKPVLWLPPGGREELAAFGTRFGTPDMFVRVFKPMEYAEGEPFAAAGARSGRRPRAGPRRVRAGYLVERQRRRPAQHPVTDQPPRVGAFPNRVQRELERGRPDLQAIRGREADLDHDLLRRRIAEVV